MKTSYDAIRLKDDYKPMIAIKTEESFNLLHYLLIMTLLAIGSATCFAVSFLLFAWAAKQ